MMEVRFAVKALLEMDVKGRLADAKLIAQKTGKPVWVILADMVGCAVRYGAGPADYKLFELYSKTPAQRGTYVTRGMNNALVKKYNDLSQTHKIDIKTEFYQYFAGFTGRRYLPVKNITREALAEVCEGKTRVLYKPADGCCGKGIELIDLTKWSREKLYLWLWERQDGLLGEIVEQHHAMAEIYPCSVNTIRLVTLHRDGVTTPVFAFLRMGMEGKVVDNLNSAGIAAKLELADGSINLPAAGKDGCLYYRHPQTGTAIVGFKVPHWDKVLQIAREAAQVVPEVGYVGWDIAVREDDVVLIEGNSYPGHDILQLPAYTPDNTGLKSAVADFV